jgi:hypothetical protein
MWHIAEHMMSSLQVAEDGGVPSGDGEHLVQRSDVIGGESQAHVVIYLRKSAIRGEYVRHRGSFLDRHEPQGTSATRQLGATTSRRLSSRWLRT